MAFYAIDLRDGVIQRMTQECYKVDNERFFLIEAGSAKQAWTKASSAPETNGSAVCGSCRHRLCSFCEDCSAAKQYSDYWICHRCGELKVVGKVKETAEKAVDTMKDALRRNKPRGRA